MLFKSGLIFSVLTAVSRVLGLMRDILLAILIGVSAGTDVFFVALSFSQMLRGLALEGPVLQTMVSTFSRHALNKGMHYARTLGARLSGLVALVALVLLLFFFAVPDALIALVGSGFLFDPERSEIARTWLPLAFSYILPIFLVGIMVALQNSAHHFASSAFTPIIFNICVILAIWLGAEAFNDHAPYPLVLLSIPIAGICQYAFHCWRSINLDLYQRPHLASKDKDLRALLVLLGPALLTLLVTQSNTIVNNIIGSFMSVGVLSWMNLANRVAILPVGVIGIALVTVFVPTLARLHAQGDESGFTTLLLAGMRLLLVLSIPAAVGIYLLAEPIALSLFQYGYLSVFDAHHISLILRVLALNIPASMLSSLFVAAFFARQQPKIALRISLWLLPCSIIIKILLIAIVGTFHLPFMGLAVGISLVAWINAALLWMGLYRSGTRLTIDSATYSTIWRILIALIAMSAILLLGGDMNWHDADWSQRVFHLLADCLGGALIYFSVIWLLGERIPPALLNRT